MKFLFHPTSQRMVTILVGFKAGARAETGKYSHGLAHFCEHMMFKGTAKRDYLQLNRDMAYLGGDFNAYTDYEKVVYHIKVPFENFEAALEIFSDMILHPLFPADELEKEKDVVQSELLRKYDSVHALLYDAFYERFFEDRLAVSVLGTEESISGFSRDELVSFYKEYYNPEHGIVMVTGNLEQSLVSESLTKYFGPESYSAAFVDVPDFKYKPVFNVVEHRENTEQTYLVMAYPGLSFQSPSKEHVLDILLNNILGSDMDSRLFTEVREKNNLCYQVGMGSSAYLNSGYTSIYSELSKANLEKAIEIINQEVDKITTELVTEEELQRAKNKDKSDLYSLLDSSSAYSSDLFMRELFGLPSLDEEIKLVDEITREEIKEYAAKRLDKSKQSVLVLREVE